MTCHSSASLDYYAIFDRGSKTRFFFIFIGLLLIAIQSVKAEETPIVSVSPLSKLAIYPETAAPAVVISLNNSPIAAQVDALVVDIPVRVGDSVKAGAVLVQLACQDFELEKSRLQAERQAIQAKFELSQWQLKQAETLAAQQTLPEEQVKERRSQLAVIKGDLAADVARIETIERQIAHCTVKAPFAGIVTERLISVGQFATRGGAMVRLLDVSHPEVSAHVSSRDALTLPNAKNLRFEHNGEQYPLNIRTLLPLINSETCTQEVRLDFVKRIAEVGAAGRFHWNNSVMHVPAEYLVKRGEHLGVFINQHNLAHFHLLPDAKDGLPAAINLPPETELIVNGQFSLNEGMAINAKVKP